MSLYASDRQGMVWRWAVAADAKKHKKGPLSADKVLVLGGKKKKLRQSAAAAASGGGSLSTAHGNSRRHTDATEWAPEDVASAASTGDSDFSAAVSISA